MVIHKIECNKKTIPDVFLSGTVSEHHLLLFSRASMILPCRGGQKLYPKSQAVFFRPGSFVSFAAGDTPPEYDFFSFDLSEDETAVIDELVLPFDLPARVINEWDATSLLMKIEQLHNSADFFRAEKATAYYELLLYSLADGEGTEGKAYQLRKEMSHLRRSIWDAPAKYVDSSAAAAEVGLSLSRFEHLYRQYFGKTFIEDRIQARIDHAKSLLFSTSMTIEAIAERTGYSSISHFHKQFLKNVGCTPAEYRKQASNMT